MYREIKIGERNIPMLAVASVNIYYRRVFREDPIILLADKEISEGIGLQFCMQMGFIMAMMAEAQGNREKLNTLNEDAYIEWLDGLDNGGYIDAASEIMYLYNGQKETKSQEKKEDAQ